MLLRDGRGPFFSRADLAFFFPMHVFESDSTAPVEIEKWKYWYEEMDGG
jgi:hypothetical protein